MGSEAAISIIYPPPELRNIVDKTAGFVARNGPEFETRIQQNEPNNPKFNFLKQGDPYNAYYQFKVKELREAATNGGSTTSAAPALNESASTNKAPASVHMSMATPADTKEKEAKATADDTSTVGGFTTIGTKNLENIMDLPVITREPPPSYEFSDDPPSINAFDLDLIKLTAQSVAIHGRSFLTNLMSREQRNFQFDFLRPQHGMFTYFTQLIEQYSKILMPSKAFLSLIKKETTDTKSIIEKIRYRAEWTRIIEAEKRREEEEAERERIQYAQIDWHDFVIVETVDYQPNETGTFPPPTTPEQVGSRLLLQQRLEANGDDAVEMDFGSDGEKEDEEQPMVEGAKEAEKAKELPPLPPSLDNVLIRKDYDPKASKTSAPTSSTSKPVPENYVISPITGEKIPAGKLADHMRYSLLDPRWVEQRDKTIQEKMAQEEVYAAGSAIENSLKNLAERRTDIFGSGVEETSIGQKIGEEEEPSTGKDKVTWDGFNTSVEATNRAARANITIEDQIAHIAKLRGDDKDKIGPAIPGQTNTSASIMKGPQAATSSAPIFSAPPMSVPPPLMSNPQTSQIRPGQDAYLAMHHAHMASMFGGPPMMGGHEAGGLLPPPMFNPQQVMGVPPPPAMGMPMPMDTSEPVFKKLRTEESLLSESEFLRKIPSIIKNVQVQIQIPNSQERTEWKLNGQMLCLSMPYKTTVLELKTMIQEATNMPPQKQKLQYDGMFLKDTNSLAFYNMPQMSTIVVGLKERGGRKK